MTTSHKMEYKVGSTAELLDKFTKVHHDNSSLLKLRRRKHKKGVENVPVVSEVQRELGDPCLGYTEL